MSKSHSVEYRTFKCHYATLKVGLGRSMIVDQAYARDLITKAERDDANRSGLTPDEKNGKLVDAIELRILDDPSKYYTFLNILQEEAAFTSLADKLTTTFRQSCAEATSEVVVPPKDDDITAPDPRKGKLDVQPAGCLRELDIIGETSLRVTNEAQIFQWPSHGLVLDIPPCSLPAGVKMTTIDIKATLTGHFEFLKNGQLVSAGYIVHSTPAVVFTQPIKMEVQHCATPSDHPSLTFARASQEGPPYKFTDLVGGLFSSISSCACIKLDRFSIFGVIIQALPTSRQPEMQYCAHVYYTREAVKTWTAHFVVTHNLEACFTAAGKRYREAVAGPVYDVTFEGEEISLQVPRAGVTVNDWTITRNGNAYPEVAKKQVDNYELGGRLPSCQLLIRWSGTDTSKKMLYKVELKGTRKPCNFLLESESLVPEQTTLPRRAITERAEKLIKDYDVDSKTILGSEFELRIICGELADVSDWYSLGVELGLPHRILSNIECDYSRVTRRIQEVIGAWLRYDMSASWSKLADSVAAMDHRDIAERIRSKYTAGHNGHSQTSTALVTGAGDTPDLIQLLKFPGKTKSFSVATEIGIKYKQFGIFLLNDSRGAKVDAIALKNRNDSEQINIEILQLWLAGQGMDVSWGTLIEVLNNIGLRQLAIDIASVKKQ